MPKRKYNHTHQYHKTYPKGFGVSTRRTQWECALPDCTHYLPGNMAEPIGKMSLCNGCMEPFILNEENMKNDKPMCGNCTSPETILALPDNFDFERHEAQSYIAEKTGRPFEEISEDEVTKLVNLRRLDRS